MPSKKPVIQAVIEENYYKKFLILCEKNDRTSSKMAKLIIKDYIDRYEKINGEINISSFDTETEEK